jgi:peptide/nickel transport system permease protein
VASYLFSRVLQAVLTLIVAVSLVFVAVRVVPGNPLLARFGQHPDLEQMEKLRREYGWDQPLYRQLGNYFYKFATTGDLGESIMRNGSKIDVELRDRVPATIELTLGAMVVSIPLGLLVGVIAARWPRSWSDHAAALLSLLGVSVPVFFIGMVLRSIFSGMPTSQRLPATVFDFEPITHFMLVDTVIRGRFDLLWQAMVHLCLPMVALSTIPTAIIARITRASLLEAMNEDYIRTARAKGASIFRTILRHAFPNAAVPIVNIAGLQVGMLLSGAVLTESVFAWPGLGKYLTDAVHDRDYPVVEAGAIVVAAIFVAINLLLDVAYAWLDPRIRHH